MKEVPNTSQHPAEPNRQELPPAPAYDFPLNRRRFFKVLGSGLAVAFVFRDILASPGPEAAAAAPVPTDQIGAWLHIGQDGTVQVFTGKVEVGQNIRTSLAQIVAEELRVPIDAIRMVMGDTDLVPYDAGTFGSRTTPQMGTQLRQAAATAREALVEMAAKNWKTTASSLQVANGKISHPKNRKTIGYGQLTKGKQLLLPISENAPVTPAERWQVAGTSAPKANGRSFVTGQHQYVSDLKMPDLVHGKVLRAPAYGAKLLSVDLAPARALPGVTVVRDGDFVGVTAPSPRLAAQALASLRAEWETTDQPSREDIFSYFKENAQEGQSRGGRTAGNEKGNLKQGLAAADLTHQSTYTIDYIAHVPLEPRAAVAQWTNGKLTVWTGTQRPFGVQQELADSFRLAKEQVRVIMPDTGSGYGGKHSGEAAIEAARLAKAAQQPVKLVWTREEEFTWAYFRPAGVIEVRGGVKKDGTLTAWEFHNYNSGGAGINTQYEIPNQLIQYHPSKTPLKQGSYRGLASTANVFAREAHLADLAHRLKMDQLAFRLHNLQDPRLRAVLEAAAQSFGWGKAKTAANHGYGIACAYEKGGYVAACAEVAVHPSTGEVTVLRLTEAFECGAIVNPRHLENQILGSVVQGLGGALFEAIDFAEGKILNPRLSRYRVPRFRDMPKINIVMVDRKDLPSAGAGETPIVGVAPAIRNAILDASGIELYTLPLVPKGVVG
jgi:nicotinate dehydrogenase subunit B